MLDKLSEKIDYMFRRGKNADERCFDFFLRSVTFFIILLAVLTYGGLVQASADPDTTFSEFINLDYFINSSSVSTFFEENYDSPYTNSSDFPLIFSNTLNPAPFNDEYFSLYQTNFDNYHTDVTTEYTKKYCVIFGPQNANSNLNGAINYFTILEIYSDDIPVLIDKAIGYTDRSLTDYCVYAPDGAFIQEYSFGFSYNSFDGYRTQRFTNTSVNTQTELGTYDLASVSYSSSHICYADIPIYSFVYSNVYDSAASDTRHFTTLSDFIDAIDQKQVYQLNPYDSIINPQEPDVLQESDENNLYLDDVQIGLTSVANGQDLLSSEVVIGVSTESDYIINHIDNYTLNVNFQLHIKDTMSSSPNDPTTNYSIDLPLKAFLNEPANISIIDIMQASSFPSGSTYSNFYYYYYTLLNQNGYVVKSDGTFQGIIPIITNTYRTFFFGNYHLVQPDLPTYTIHDFTLSVTCWLTSDKTLDESGNYTKVFDFLHGSSSISSAGLLVNNNPWLGEKEPSANPLIPTTGNNSVGSYSGGNTNVNVSVSGQKVPIGVKTRAEIETILNNYKDVNDNFMDQWQDLSDPNNNNNFIKFLNQETRQLPAVDYLITGACCIFGLSIILFILKVLLF